MSQTLVVRRKKKGMSQRLLMVGKIREWSRCSRNLIMLNLKSCWIWICESQVCHATLCHRMGGERWVWRIIRWSLFFFYFYNDCWQLKSLSFMIVDNSNQNQMPYAFYLAPLFIIQTGVHGLFCACSAGSAWGWNGSQVVQCSDVSEGRSCSGKKYNLCNP